MTSETITRASGGLAAVEAMFAHSAAAGRAAFLPYFPIGYPTYAESLDAVEAMAKVGVDGFELGIPFSDPLADGPVNQAAAQIALDNGTTVSRVLQAVRELRSRGITQPMLMFTYLNPLIAYGTEKFVTDAKAAGADGLMIPDLPPEEAHLFAAACQRENMALVFFLAPTSNPERIRFVGEVATGFIYVVSVTGITGARTALPDDLVQFIQRVRGEVQQPLVMGFGISTPEHARAMTGLVEGFIVGSALVKIARTEGVPGVQALATALRNALD
jgi:tryptophan synthase alpha chain